MSPTDDAGATAVEYAIMVSLIAVVVIVAVAALGTETSELHQCTSDAIDAAATYTGAGCP